VLSTMPNSNSLARIHISIPVYENPPFNAAKSQKWDALAREIVRIYSGKPLRFELHMDIQLDEPEDGYLNHDVLDAASQVKELRSYIQKEMKALRTAEGIEVDSQTGAIRRSEGCSGRRYQFRYRYLLSQGLTSSS
jgi:hypothetical protein